jgi:hypothetical protein
MMVPKCTSGCIDNSNAVQKFGKPNVSLMFPLALSMKRVFPYASLESDQFQGHLPRAQNSVKLKQEFTEASVCDAI